MKEFLKRKAVKIAVGTLAAAGLGVVGITVTPEQMAVVIDVIGALFG